MVERWERPILHRDYDYEQRGLEDPRVTKIGDTFYMTYVAHDGKNAQTAYAESSDLTHFDKKGIISAQLTYQEAEELFQEQKLKDQYKIFASYYEDEAGQDVLLWHKDIFLFPRKIQNKYILVHRILPDIQLAFFDNFNELGTKNFWFNHIQNLHKFVLLENKHWFETQSIGGGCVPIETDAGWLFIFHAIESRNIGRVYHACAALLDKETPLHVLGRLHEPLFSPTEEWERSGMVSNVVFPTGTAQFGDTLYIYYGAADKRIAVAELSISELIAELLNPANHH